MIFLGPRGKKALPIAALSLAALVLWWWVSRPLPSLQDLPAGQRALYSQHIRQAEEQMRQERWEGAKADLEFCLDIYDQDPKVHTYLAKVHLGLRRQGATTGITEADEDEMVEFAIAGLDRALEIDPGYIPALMARHRVRLDPTYRRYDPDAALEDGEELLRQAPENTFFRQQIVRWLLGTVRFREPRDGVRAFDSSIGLEAAERHVEQILDCASRGSDLCSQALHGRGIIYNCMGDFESAADTLEKLSALPITSDLLAEVLLDRGFALYRLARHEEAAECYVMAMETDTSLEATWLLRLAYEGMGRAVGALPLGQRFQIPGEELDPDSAGRLRFTEVGKALGVAKVGGAGASAFADYDNDGDADLLVAGCDTLIALFRNDGGKFTDVTIEAGLHELESGSSTNLVDYDNDGHLDIYCGRNGWSGPAPNVLLRNRGDGTFEDRSKESGLDDPGSGTASLWSDFDRDGLLDVFIANGVIGDGHTNRLYRNRGDGTFEDATERAGLAESRRWRTIGAAIGDYDRDGDPDIFVNGWGEAPNRLYRNGGNGRFEEVAEEARVTGPRHSGTATFFVDVNNDAYPDLLVTSLAGWESALKGLAGKIVPTGPQELPWDAPRLYRNDRDGTFSDITFESGLVRSLGVMGGNAGDLDNDGYVDLYLATGGRDLKRLEPDVFYHNTGDGTFGDLGRHSPLGDLRKGQGFSLADLDLDGDLDIYAPRGGFFHGDHRANHLYRNEAGNENHWSHLRLRGTKSNRFAVGAQVTLESGEFVQYREVGGGSGFGSTHSYPVEFGLGDRTKIDEIEILWPSGERQELKGPPVDALLEVEEGGDGWRVIHTGR